MYTISQSGATSEMAKWLAEKENRADLIGGVGSVSLDDKDDMLAGVLLDLSMTASLSASLEMGEAILLGLKPISRLHKKNVEQAAFLVLKSPDIPSLLIETGFISNPGEARKYFGYNEFKVSKPNDLINRILLHSNLNLFASIRLFSSKISAI